MAFKARKDDMTMLSADVISRQGRKGNLIRAKGIKGKVRRKNKLSRASRKGNR